MDQFDPGIGGAAQPQPIAPTQPPPVYTPPPAEQMSDTPPGAAEQGTATLEDVLAPEAIAGAERQGSGGAFLDTSEQIREWLNANGITQTTTAPGAIRIGDLVGPPSMFGLPDKAPVELFGPHGEIGNTPLEGLVRERYEAFLRAQSDAAFQQQRAGERELGGGAAIYGGRLDPEHERRLREAGVDPRTRVAYGPGDQSPALREDAAPRFSDLGLGALAGAVTSGLGAIDQPWRERLGYLLITVGGRREDFAALVTRRLAARGIADPTAFDLSEEAGEVSAELWERASGGDVPFVGGLAEAANPVWWIAAPAAAVRVGGILTSAGASPRVAGLVQSMIANGGLPYADRALNAVFVNAATRSLARRSGEAMSDISSVLLRSLPDPARAFSLDEAGTLNVEALREILGLTRKAPSPRSTMAQLRAIARENDDPALREAVLGPGGGLYRVASSGGRSRESLGMESTRTSRGGGGLVLGQGSSAVETAELRTYRQQFVARYQSVADEFDTVSSQIDDITNSESLRWGSLEPLEQFRRLAIEDDRWTPYFQAFKDAPDDETRDAIMRQGRELASQMQREKGVPFTDSDAQHFPGDNATDLLANKAVLETRLRALWQQGQDLLKDIQRPTPVKRVHTVVQRSARAFDVVTPDGRMVGTERTLKGAQQRAHDLDITQQQTTLPGTPEVQAPELRLENPALTDEQARAARGPAGQQSRLEEMAPLTDRGRMSPEAVESLSADVSPSAAAEARRGLPGEMNAETISQRIGKPETPAQAIQRYQTIGNRVVDLEKNVSVSVHKDPYAAREEATRLNAAAGAPPPAAPAKVTEAAPTGPRFEVRAGQIYDTKLDKVDTILTGRVNEKPHASAEARDAQMERWAKWANKRVDAGDWREHQPIVPPGQKLVPEETEILPPGQVATPKGEQPPGQPPRKPPTKEELFPPDQPPEDEGPNTLIWRVVDRGDGTFSLGRVDLERGLTISGERFADREGALITAEARNASEDAITMVDDTLERVRRLLEDEPQLALMSPGQAKAINAAIVAERKAAATVAAAEAKALTRHREQLRTAAAKAATKTAIPVDTGRVPTLIEREAAALARRLETLALPAPSGRPLTRTAEQQADIDKALRHVVAARVKMREKLAADPAYGLRSPGTPPPTRLPAGETPLAYPNPTVPEVAVAARETLTTLELLTQATAGRTRGQALRAGAGAALPIASTVSRTLLTGLLDAGSIARQMAILGVRSLPSGSRRSVFAETAGMVFRSYFQPGVIQDRALKATADAIGKGGTRLHLRSLGEFGGESVGERTVQVIESLGAPGELVRRSQIAFNEPLNFFGAKTFSLLVDANAKAVARGQRNVLAVGPFKGIGPRVKPMTQADKDQLADVINHQLGFADVAGWAERKPRAVQGLVELSRFLYAPNWQASRAAVLADFAKALPNVLTLRASAAEKEAFWNGLMFSAANVSLVLGVASQTGVEIEVDPRSVNFMRLPLGEPSPQTGLLAGTLSTIGVTVSTYNGIVYADFSSGIGADIRLIAGLFPFGGDSDDIITGKIISATGVESDPYHPEFGQRGFQNVVIDWLTSRGGPGTQVTETLIAPRGEEAARPVLERMMEALVRSYIPMVAQDSSEASGVFDTLEWEKWMESLRAPWQAPAPTPTPRPTLRPRSSVTPPPARPSATFDPRAYR